ncbi:hypothetical protein BJQ90_03431 [Arthrobacter sp. SO3]|nr:hypothetical protein [Arthrobacter sp. SO3]
MFHQPHGAGFDDLHREFNVPGGEGVVHRVAGESIVRIPAGGDQVQFLGPARVIALQAAAQVVFKEVVIAVPRAVLVKRLQEQILCLDFLQHGLAQLHPREGGGQPRAQPFRNRRHQEEIQRFGVEGVEDVFGQIFADGRVPARETFDQF